MKTKTIKIGYTTFALPEGMSLKDIQALAGFLLTLTEVRTEYDWLRETDMYYLDAGTEVRLGEVIIQDKDKVKQLHKESRAAYEAKRAAEKEAA